MMPQGLIKEPDIRPEERKMPGFGNDIFPNLFRKGGEDLPAEGYVYNRIRHDYPSFSE